MTTNLDDLSELIVVPRELEESSRFPCSSCCWIMWNSCWRAFFRHENNLWVWVSIDILKPWPRNSLSFHCSWAGRGGEITMKLLHLYKLCWPGRVVTHSPFFFFDDTLEKCTIFTLYAGWFECSECWCWLRCRSNDLDL